MRRAHEPPWPSMFWLGLVLAIARTDAADNATKQIASMHLTALDYVEIQQLSARYAFAIENCTNHGYDYADLYTDDGTFAVSQSWGDPGKVYARGARGLRGLMGGRPEDVAIRRRYSGTG